MTTQSDEQIRDDLTGRRFNKITVVGLYNPTKPISSHNDQWWCVCDCSPDQPERKFPVYRSRLIKGTTQSCGCLARQRLAEHRTTHGMCSVRAPHHLYSTWEGMKGRCSQPNHSQWKYYGARGIKVCDRWNEFKNFVQDMEPTWQAGLTLDRRESDGDYCPENCLWRTPKEQQNNRRCCVRVTMDGKTKTLMEWSEKYKINYATVQARRRLGWTDEAVFKTPVVFQQDSGPARKLTYLGKTQGVMQWCKELGIKSNLVYARLKLGWDDVRALTEPVQKKLPNGTRGRL